MDLQEAKIIKTIHGEYLYIIDCNNQGTMLTKDKYGRTCWTGFQSVEKILK